MSIFRWTAPLFKLASRRWSANDFAALAGMLRPFVPPSGQIIDLAGGTGDLGLGVAAALNAHVVVADTTAQMLARVDAAPFVSVTLASAEHLPFPSGRFDALLCSDAFHHFRDQTAATQEIARVVRPGGAVLILELEPTGAVRLAAGLERLVREPAAFLRSDQLVTLMACHGIDGTITRRRGVNYSFLGVRA
jgi:ubiquinone/menaquinone biosynthesis C-methylase UbiE